MISLSLLFIIWDVTPQFSSKHFQNVISPPPPSLSVTQKSRMTPCRWCAICSRKRDNITVTGFPIQVVFSKIHSLQMLQVVKKKKRLNLLAAICCLSPTPASQRPRFCFGKAGRLLRCCNGVVVGKPPREKQRSSFQHHT